MDDLQVIEQIKFGDTQAFELLVQRYQRPLFHYLGRMGLTKWETEELVQEAFIRAFEHLPGFEPQRALFSTWLFTITRRLALNLLNRHRRVCGDWTHETESQDPSCTPYEACDQSLIKQRIAVAVQQLPLKYRSPLALAYLNDLSTAEIAQIEDCAEGTVKSRIHRAKQQLKLQLDDLLGEDDHA